MKNASGHHRDEDRWPLPVLAIPRGLREITWHVVALAAIVAPLTLRAGWFIVILVAGLTWLFELPSKLLFELALRGVIAGVVIGAIVATPGAALVSITRDFDWSAVPDVGVLFSDVLFLVFDLSVALCSVATLIAFDRRSVNRSAVDLRVWQRQQTRRRHLLRRWHRSRTIPEVSS